MIDKEEATIYYLKLYGAKLAERIKEDCEGSLEQCWRRMALIVGASLTRHPLRLITAVKGDVFQGLAEAMKPSRLDRLFLEEGELTPFTEYLLRYSLLSDVPNIYTPFSTCAKDIASEVKKLAQRWEERGEVALPEAIYALGLAALLAKTSEPP